MAFIETDRAKIRKYLGLSSMYLRNNARFEDAVTICQSRTDGGSMADNSTELLLKEALSEIALIEQNIKDLRIQAHVKKAGSDDIELDVARGTYLLKSQGRRHLTYIANTLGLDLDDCNFNLLF